MARRRLRRTTCPTAAPFALSGGSLAANSPSGALTSAFNVDSDRGTGYQARYTGALVQYPNQPRAPFEFSNIFAGLRG